MARRVLLLWLAFILLLSVGACAGPPPVPAADTALPATTVAEAATPAPSAEASATLPPSATPTPPATDTATPAADTATPTASRSATSTATATSTTRPAPTATATAKPSATATRTPTPVPPTATPLPPTATPRKEAGRIFLGYYVPYDSSSWASLQAQVDTLDYVALQIATLDYCGNVSSKDDRTLHAFASAHGLPVLASLFTSSTPLNHSVLTNPSSSANAITQLVDYVVAEGYDGLDVDVESVAATDRAALTSFVANLSAALHRQGKLITMAVPAKTREVTTGWAGAYDYAALAAHLDLVTIMSYAYTTASSAPGSTAPYNWVDQVATYAAGQFPPEKVLLGMAFYGYDWNTTAGGRARGLLYSQAAALATHYGATITLDPTTRSATFAYQADAKDALPYQPSPPLSGHEIADNPAPFCPLTPPAPTPRPVTPTPTPTGMQSHTVWLENAASVAAKLDIAARHGLRGAAAWRLGQEDPASWPAVAAWK